MATMPVNNQNLTNPLLTPKASDAKKAKAAPGVDTGAAATAQKGAKGGTPGDYGVSISSDAKDRAAAQQKATDIAKATPDVREDRVASLKTQINAGTYQVDSGKIADGMLREAIKEHLSETDR